MLTAEDDMEITSLRQRGWSISAIARHIGRDRKTVRAYLNGERTPGVRARAVDPFAPFLGYMTARLVEDPHLWALTLFERAARARVRAVLSEPDPRNPHPEPAPGLHRMRGGRRGG